MESSISSFAFERPAETITGFERQGLEKEVFARQPGITRVWALFERDLLQEMPMPTSGQDATSCETRAASTCLQQPFVVLLGVHAAVPCALCGLLRQQRSPRLVATEVNNAFITKCRMDVEHILRQRCHAQYPGPAALRPEPSQVSPGAHWEPSQTTPQRKWPQVAPTCVARSGIDMSSTKESLGTETKLHRRRPQKAGRLSENK